MTRTRAPMLAKEDARVPTRSAEVRWRIGPEAARDAFQTEGGAILLAIRVREQAGGGWRGEAVLEAGGGEPRPLLDGSPQVRWARDPDRGLMHIDAPGFFSVTLDLTGEHPALLYARTAMLGALGVRGGRYEPADARLEPGGHDRDGS